MVPRSEQRVRTLERHLVSSSTSRLEEDGTGGKVSLSQNEQESLDFGILESLLPSEGEYNIAEHLPGPLQTKSWEEAFVEYQESFQYGLPHLKFVEWQREYGGEEQLAANIVVPQLVYTRKDIDVGPRIPPKLTQEVIISNPQDAARIARIHVRKQPNFTPAFYGSIISTVDNQHWKQQREDINPAFLPKASLEQIFPISAARAQYAAEKLRQESENGAKAVDMNEFLLHETQAQLQLALFGEDESFMNETNEQFRRSMAGEGDFASVRQFCKELFSRMGREQNTGPAVPGSGCPVHGPLSNRLAGMGASQKTSEGNALIFAFAGHDTTGHTMTWLLYELAKAPELQQRLQAEVDEFFALIGERNPTYQDLFNMPFMTKCIMETLRLWPAVANGTFRQIQFDDYITGPGGKQVRLPKGTHVRIFNWSRHRNPDLWGDDVLKFNPDREFKDSEIWHNKVIRSYNPATPRFSPFTFPPRDCIGKNFAHMEARLIMAHLLKHFSFELTDEYKNLERDETIGINYGTLAPRDLTRPPLIETRNDFAVSPRAPSGLPFKVVPRV